MCRYPERQDAYVHRVAKDLAQFLALFLAEVTELLQSVLAYPSKGLVDASNAPLLTPKFWVQAIYTELLHASGRYRAVREQEQKRPTTGLVKVLCFSYDKKARKEHEKKKNSQTTFEGTVELGSWADTLFVWFPASWMPLVVEAIRNKSSTWLRGNHLQGTVARNDGPNSIPDNREVSYKLKTWHVDRRGQSPILHARTNIDWLTLDSTCVTRMFPLLYDGILRDVFNQKASMAWQPASTSRIVVSLLLPGSMSADEWLVLARKKRHMWPMQMTAQLAALDLPTAKFIQRERGRLKTSLGELAKTALHPACHWPRRGGAVQQAVLQYL